MGWKVGPWKDTNLIEQTSPVHHKIKINPFLVKINLLDIPCSRKGKATEDKTYKMHSFRKLFGQMFAPSLLYWECFFIFWPGLSIELKRIGCIMYNLYTRKHKHTDRSITTEQSAPPPPPHLPEQRNLQNRETANIGLVSSVGRAPARQSGGRKFKSRSRQLFFVDPKLI